MEIKETKCEGSRNKMITGIRRYVGGNFYINVVNVQNLMYNFEMGYNNSAQTHPLIPAGCWDDLGLIEYFSCSPNVTAHQTPAKLIQQLHNARPHSMEHFTMVCIFWKTLKFIAPLGRTDGLVNVSVCVMEMKTGK